MKRCFLTVTIIAAMMMSITACSTNNDNSSNAVSSKSSSSTSSSSSTPISTPETKPAMRSHIKQKIDKWYNMHNEAQKTDARLKRQYGEDFSKVPASDVSRVVSELENYIAMVEESQNLMNELMDMEDVMNNTEKEYFLEKLKAATGG